MSRSFRANQPSISANKQILSELTPTNCITSFEIFIYVFTGRCSVSEELSRRAKKYGIAVFFAFLSVWVIEESNL